MSTSLYEELKEKLYEAMKGKENELKVADKTISVGSSDGRVYLQFSGSVKNEDVESLQTIAKRLGYEPRRVVLSIYIEKVVGKRGIFRKEVETKDIMTISTLGGTLHIYIPKDRERIDEACSIIAEYLEGKAGKE